MAAPIDSVDITLIRTSLQRQYHAGLAMLRHAIELCPDDSWADSRDPNPFWRVAYHTLFFTHLYLMPHARDFEPWVLHQTHVQYFEDPDDDEAAVPSAIDEMIEFPHRPPQTGVPYTRAQILDYWAFCSNLVDRAVDALDLTSAESGFYWYDIPKLEHQLVALRHLEHHVGELGHRIRRDSDQMVDWAGSRES